MYCQSWHLIIKNFSLRFDFLCAISINLLKSAQIFAPVRIIAVMFTFSFGSAFATVPWTGEKTNAYLTEAKEYASVAGEEGITEAYRAHLTKEAKAELKFVKSGYTAEDGTKTEAPFYAPEKAEAYKSQLEAQGITVSSVESLCVVIATHLVEGALVLGLTPKFTK